MHRTLALPIVVVTLLASGIARADDDCPIGAKSKSEGGYTWCEPTICDSDAQCSNGEVCKPVALCVQVGALKPTSGAAIADAGQRLMATGRCGPDKSCPQTTTCSDKGRCISRAAAEKAGLMPASTGSAPPSGAAGDTKKSSCGCHTPGVVSSSSWALAAGALAIVIGARRRRR